MTSLSLSWLRNFLLTPTAKMLLPVLLLTGSLGCMSGCDEEDDNKLPEACSNIEADWLFTFSEPIDRTFLLTGRHLNYSIFTPTPVVPGDPVPSTLSNCAVLFYDLSENKTAFEGTLDGTELKAETRIGSTWKIRGTVNMVYNEDGYPTAASTITGYWTIDSEWEGTFTAKVNVPFPTSN